MRSAWLGDDTLAHVLRALVDKAILDNAHFRGGEHSLDLERIVLGLIIGWDCSLGSVGDESVDQPFLGSYPLWVLIY